MGVWTVPYHGATEDFLRSLIGIGEQGCIECPCACNGRNPDCGGDIIAAHVDYAGKGTPDAKGTSSKVADKWNIPLSVKCHALQHSMGWPWFDQHILGRPGAGADMASGYWFIWPGRRAWEAKQ